MIIKRPFSGLKNRSSDILVLKKLHSICLCSIFTIFSLYTCSAQNVKYEAEQGILNGSVSVQNSQPGFSGTGYVGRFENEGDRVDFSISISEPGSYRIYIGFASPYGEKINNISINGNTAEVTFISSSAFIEVLFGKVILPSGINSLSVNKNWGWFLLDYIRLEKNTDPEVEVKIPYQLSTPLAMIETRRLFSYLMDNFGKNIHSGTMSLNGIEEAEWIYSQTGKYPALIGLDFMNHNRDWSWYDKTTLVTEACKWYRQNGLVAVNWHWRDPSKNTDEFYTDKTGFDISRITDVNSAEYKALVADIDIISGYIKQLQDSTIPFLFRPLHEASGKWFWWGAKGAEPCKALWKLMYNRMVNYHGLKNMIWVWTTDTKSDNMDWYPGDAYVDILGVDIYAANGDLSSQVLTYNKIKEDFQGRKLITLSENGPVPDPDNLVTDKANWSWFMTWYGSFVHDPAVNPLSHWQKVMNHNYVITLDEMPDLKNYPLDTKADEYQSDNFRVYFSSSDGYLHINPSDYTGRYDLYVSDISGRLIFYNLKNFESISVSLSVLRPGIYIVRIVTLKGFQSYKIVR
jgi:mannan endo-1,4-beta-mannosidase